MAPLLRFATLLLYLVLTRAAPAAVEFANVFVSGQEGYPSIRIPAVLVTTGFPIVTPVGLGVSTSTATVS